MEYPLDPSLETVGDEFLFGSSLLVAPVLDAGVRERLTVFPSGKWYPFAGGEPLIGSQKQACPLDECLIYAKEGAIIPLYPSLTKNLDVEPDELILRLFPGNGSFLHYQDNGSDYAYEKGEYNLYLFTNTNGILSLKLLHEKRPLSQAERERFSQGVDPPFLFSADWFNKKRISFLNKVNETSIAHPHLSAKRESPAFPCAF